MLEVLKISAWRSVVKQVCNFHTRHASVVVITICYLHKRGRKNTKKIVQPSMLWKFSVHWMDRWEKLSQSILFIAQRWSLFLALCKKKMLSKQPHYLLKNILKLSFCSATPSALAKVLRPLSLLRPSHAVFNLSCFLNNFLASQKCSSHTLVSQCSLGYSRTQE